MGGRRITPFMKQCFVTSAVGINLIGLGSAVGFPAILPPQLKKPDSFIPLTKGTKSWIASVLALSFLPGNFLAPPIMDRFGRKAAHSTISIISLIGWLITILATSAQALIIGRICLGIAAGLLATLRSILIGEYTSPRNRGAFLTTVSLTHAFGIFFVHLVGSLLSWQKTALICLFFPFTSLIMTIYSPESPSRFLTKGRYDECRSVFRWLRGPEEDEELEDMIEARIAFEQAVVKEQKISWFANLINIIRKREFYKPILILIHINVIMQFSGATTMPSYCTVIIGLLMGSKVDAQFWMIFLDIQRIVLNTVAIFIIHKVKRRVMVFTPGVLSAVSHFAIAVYVYYRINGWDYDAVWLPGVLISLQVIALAMGTVPMPQVIGGEVFPLEYKSIAGTTSLAVGGGTMFLSVKTFPALIDKTGLHGTYMVYGSILLVNLIVVLLLLPETKGKTLQEIEDGFRGRPLRIEGIEAKQSLRLNPVENKRKMSEKEFSSSLIV